MVVTKVKQIKSINKLSSGLDYIQNPSKTTTTKLIDSDLHFPVQEKNGKLVSQLVSAHLIIDVDTAFSEIMQLKQLANIQKGRPLNYDKVKENNVLVHHVIQSFDPNDPIDPETAHAIGRQTALELTNEQYQFVIATHMDQGHLHNHIYINSTNSVTMNKFRWQKGTAQSLFNISNKYADLAGAKVLERKKQFGHKEYDAYRKKNVYKLEIKSRLEFLLKHSIDIDDFKSKAQVLNLEICTEGKYVKYKLLDYAQQRYTRDRTLSKKGRYSLEQIEERLSKNGIDYPIEWIKEEYDRLQVEKSEDFEMRIKIEPWQVEHETDTGIYLNMQYGIANQGTVKIPMKLVDKQDDGSYDIFIKKSDFFYFINPDNSTSNKFLKGSTLVKQLSYDSGEYILNKNPNISKLKSLVKEYNYLIRHDITDSEQFYELEQRFIEQIKNSQAALKQLDQKIENLNKIAAALEDIRAASPVDEKAAHQVLQEFAVDARVDPKDIEKQLVEVSVERKTLQDTFDNVIKDFTNYKNIERNAKERQVQKSLLHKEPDELDLGH